MANLAANPVARGPVTTGRSQRVRAGRQLVLAAAALLALPAFAYLAVRATLPSDGAHLRPGSDAVQPHGLVVSPLTEGPLREGDVVVAVAGVPIAELARRLVGGAGTAAHPSPLGSAWRSGTEVPYQVLRGDERLTLQIPLASDPLAAAAARTWGTILFALVTLLVASLLFARRPDLAPTRILFVGAGALVGATTWSLGATLADFVSGSGFWLFQATTTAIFVTYWTTQLHFALTFPTPHPWTAQPGFAPGLYLLPLAGLAIGVTAAWAGTADPIARVAALASVTDVLAAALLASALIAIMWQARRPRTATARRQIRWVVFGALAAGSLGLVLYLLPPAFGLNAVSANAIGPVATLFPVAVAIAVLRDHLFDIDALLNRALVYGVLTFGIGALYVAVVSVLAAAFGTRGGLGPSLLAAGLVAVSFQPLRDRVQRAVDRLLYGERDDPSAVLNRLGKRLEGALATEGMLPTLVETVAVALRLPYVALELAGDPPTRVAYGRPVRTALRLPLAHHGQQVGTLLVATRDQDEAFTVSEHALLETIARQASVAAYAVRTAEELRRSRERLVASREEERRRLRRDLHDGLGTALASLTLKLDAASNLLDRDPPSARALLRDLREQVQAATDDLRSVVHALRPPTLDDLGLAGALRALAARPEHEDLRVTFRAPDPLPTVPAGVEVAAFRIAQEALTNVVRHAQAHSCTLTLSIRDHPEHPELHLLVEDDGAGIAQRRLRSGSGLGLDSMRTRAGDLGGSVTVARRATGGTRVEVRLPLRVAGESEGR